MLEYLIIGMNKIYFSFSKMIQNEKNTDRYSIQKKIEMNLVLLFVC